MNGVLATYRRELRAYFFSPLAYVVLFFFLVVNGIIFVYLIGQLNDPRSAGGPPLKYFFSASWLMLLLLGPVITMRLVSEELRSGSIEVLMTAPVTEGQVIGGKFLASLTFYGFLWLPTLAYAGMISLYEKVDWGPVLAGYLGILLIGSLFLAVGIFASAMTRSQLLAAMMTAALLFLLFLLGVFEELVNNDVAKKALGYVSIWNHIDEFANGIVDTRRLVYYLSGTLFFLFLASRALEDKKWR
ncbi:MAG: gliding motility-associated transport system permease protein [Acidobacteriota bacterium]|jgi:ABC-2 type transport system permease protein|nr:gliding motility-associated transport system permease protein [Acidobacteriota bacterium]